MLRSMTKVLCTGAVLVALVGCRGPYKVEKFEEIGPNETAFVIPLEGETKEGQAQLQSVEFLESKRVVSKRISIPQRQHDLGRGPGNFEWIATVRVIKVDRSPVTREWTRGSSSGTSSRDEAVAVESKDSINFRAGANITCSIREEDTAKFLYYFAGKPLSEVIDTNVRGLVQTVLAREFGQRDLRQCMEEKIDAFTLCLEETRKIFAEKGLSVDYLGSSEGLLYDEKKIQDAINARFVAENDIEVAKQEKLAQDQRNTLLIEKAKAERLAAEEIAKAQEAMTLKVTLEVQRTLAEAQKIAAERWNGNVPTTILPQGSNLLFGLDAPRTQPASK